MNRWTNGRNGSQIARPISVPGCCVTKPNSWRASARVHARCTKASKQSLRDLEHQPNRLHTRWSAVSTTADAGYLED